jgi:hypothetical protein
MIVRAERSCERYGLAANEPQLSPTSVRARRRRSRNMEESLARLKAQQTSGAPARRWRTNWSA